MDDDSHSKRRVTPEETTPKPEVDVLILGESPEDSVILSPEALERHQREMKRIKSRLAGMAVHQTWEKTKNYYLSFRAKQEDPKRALISAKYPFGGLADLKEVSPEAFAREAGWDIPEDKQVRQDWLGELRRDPRKARTIEDVELLLYDALRTVLAIFDTTTPANQAFESRLPDFWSQVYPFVRKIRADLSLPGDSVKKLWSEWWHAVGLCRQHGTVLASDRDGSAICWDEAQIAVKRMFSALFRELHPMRIECGILFAEIEDMMQMETSRAEHSIGGFGSFFGQPTKPSLQFSFSAPVRAFIQTRLPILKEIAEKEQPVEEDLDNLENTLRVLVDELAKCDAPDRDDAVARVKFALSVFRETRGRVYPLERFSFPDLGTVDHASLTPSNALERGRARIAAKKEAPPIPPVPPTLTTVELADFIKHFTTGDGSRNFSTRNELDTFTEGVVGEAVCRQGSGMGKSLAAFIRNSQSYQPEIVFKLCKALLELDENRHRDDPVELPASISADSWDSEWKREAAKLRKRLREHLEAAEARAVEQAEKNIVERAQSALAEENRKRRLRELGLEGLPPWIDPETYKKPVPILPPSNPTPSPEPHPPSAPSVPTPPPHDPYLDVFQSMDKKLGQLVSGVEGTRQAAESIDASQRQSAEQAHADQERNLQAIQSLVPEPANFGNGAVDPRSDPEIIDARKWETFQAWRIQYREKKGEKEAERFSKFLIWVDTTLQGQQRSNIASSISQDDFHRYWERDRIQKSRQGI